MSKFSFIKKYMSGWNFLFFAVILYVIYLRLPGWLNNQNAQGGAAPQATVMSLDGSPIEIPSKKKQVIVFWATWCPPCKVELARLNRLVNDGQLKKDDVLAISVGEEAATVQSVSSERQYQFLVAFDESSQSSNSYQVSGTPTTLLVDELGVVQWKSTGVSPTLEVRLKSFFGY